MQNPPQIVFDNFLLSPVQLAKPGVTCCETCKLDVTSLAATKWPPHSPRLTDASPTQADRNSADPVIPWTNKPASIKNAHMRFMCLDGGLMIVRLPDPLIRWLIR